MDYVIEYVKIKKASNNIIALINQIRLYKKLYLLCELIRMNGGKKTDCYFNEIEASGIR